MPVFFIQAQTLYGTTFSGGTDNGGTLNKFIPATNSLSVFNLFENALRNSIFTKLVPASDGKLYGMTFAGGTNGQGGIFSYDPAALIYTKVASFSYSDGASPYGSLIQASNGKLYGMTLSGGNSNAGVIFSFDPTTRTITKLKDFNGTDGSNPYGSLVQASDGKLYGMTYAGGSNGVGVIFSFDPSALVYTKLKDLNAASGSRPWGSLIQASDGKLYGLTETGGVNDLGVIFSFQIQGSVYAKLKDLDNAGGCYPRSSFVQTADGKLYASMRRGGAGGGTIFSYTPATSAFLKLKDFFFEDGFNPEGSLEKASNGKLYGETRSGGSQGSAEIGTLFSFDPVLLSYTKIRDFDYFTDGTGTGSVTQASDGKLYGLTSGGGNLQGGILFSYDPLTSAYTKLRDITSATDGVNVSPGLFQATDGKLYGMTNAGGGGVITKGIIFSFNPSTSAISQLRSFDKSNGWSPYGSFIQAGNGKLYGMTAFGGDSDAGVIFSFDPITGGYGKLTDFNGALGARPYGSLIEALNGKLYGTTSEGGARGSGVIFSYEFGKGYAKLYDFDSTGTAGGKPFGNLVQASDGKIYGMTRSGGSHLAGVVFCYDPQTAVYSVKKNFDIINGANPYGSLIQASNGKLYGMTSAGGSHDLGVIFSLDLSGVYTKLKDLNNINGASPQGTLKQASDGKLYGMTNKGGNSNLGTIFSFDPVLLIYTKLQDLTGSNGASPSIGSTFIEVGGCISNTIYYRDADRDGYGNAAISILACSQPAGYVSNNGDCDDNNSCVHAPIIYYRDADGDGYGDPDVTTLVCKAIPPCGYVSNNYDCDDHMRAINAFDAQVRMCHNGIAECVFAKDIKAKQSLGYTLGLCPASSNTLVRLPRGPAKAGTALIALLPEQYGLINSPNPFTGKTTIRYELPFDSKLSIKVYDALGRALATLVDGNKKAGAYSVDFIAPRLSSGSLYYRIIATSKEQHFEQTNKMIQVK